MHETFNSLKTKQQFAGEWSVHDIHSMIPMTYEGAYMTYLYTFIHCTKYQIIYGFT